MITFSTIDIILIVGYFLGVVLIGTLWSRGKDSDLEDYLVAGRKITLFPFVATLVSTWYGGILGVGEYSYLYGIASWVAFGGFYYFWAIIYAFFMSQRIRQGRHYTIPDELAQAYDKKTSLIGAVFTFILTTPAAYVLMIGTMIQLIFGWSLMVSIIIGTAISVFYILIGGFRSVVKTDILQFLMMFIGFGLILPFAYFQYGGLEFLQTNLPASHWNASGGMSFQEIFVWFFIAAGTLVDPGFYQRCTAVKSPKIARKGILMAIGFWIVFDFMTTTAGLYARAILPPIDNPVMAYPLLAESILPNIFKAIFFIGMLSTIMSTVDSFTFISALTLGRDLFWRISSNPDTENQINTYTRIGLVITGVISIIIALYFESVVYIWYEVGSIVIPVLFLPLLMSLYGKWRVSANIAFISMICTTMVTISWFVVDQLTGSPPFGVETIYAGLLTSILIFGGGILMKKI